MNSKQNSKKPARSNIRTSPRLGLVLMKASMNSIGIGFAMAVATLSASASERFVTTLGTVQRELSADRTAMTLEVKATAPSVEESNARLERLMEDLRNQITALHYPTSALSLKFRSNRRAREWDENTKSFMLYGYDKSC